MQRNWNGIVNKEYNGQTYNFNYSAQLAFVVMHEMHR